LSIKLVYEEIKDFQFRAPITYLILGCSKSFCLGFKINLEDILTKEKRIEMTLSFSQEGWKW
jgi:hypothetical protein